METTKRIYIGGGEDGALRLKNLKKIAEKYFEGNVSALFNDAVDRIYNLDRYTGEPKSVRQERMDSFLLADSDRHRPIRRRTIRPKE